ncbi:sensor histidine kinase [Paenibacillus luteus]|uniref:sensor histidine kinase n=1 Tax=Paenibacillus luteus TaxID=2545753 RepID=UPI0011444CED|nr:sensor histidine kinase [Paenibacillus luteus]
MEQMDLFESFYEDPDIDFVDMNRVGFKVHASLIYKLGEELIADEITAISELVKNSYDADSPFVNLIVDPYYEEEIIDEYNGRKTPLTIKGQITIKDAGHGMNKKDIINGWLTISNSIKKKMKKNKEVTKKFERMPLGDKGLGRLSVQKLGNYMLMRTKKEGETTEYSVYIPWGHFRKNTTIDNVPVKVTEKNIDSSEADKGYTEIIIKGLINPDLWTNINSIRKLEKELSQIVSPFKTNSNSFYLYAKVGQIELNFNKISDEALDGAISKYSFSLTRDQIMIEGYYKPEFFEGKNDSLVNIDHLKEFMIKKSEVLKGCMFIDSPEDYYIKFEQSISLESIGELITDKLDNSILYPGNLHGEIYSYSLDPLRIKSQIQKLNFEFLDDTYKFRNYIANNKGIKVFRDDFSILPYGYGENDWLSLSANAATKGKFTDLKNDTVIGYIQLPGKESYNLREKTNREGFIVDDNYNNFELIIKLAIKRINKNRENLKKYFNEYILQIYSDTQHTDSVTLSHEIAVKKAKSVTEKIEKIATALENNHKQVNETNKIFTSVENKIEDINITTEEKSLLNQYLLQLQVGINSTNNTLIEAANYIKEIDVLKNQIKVIEYEYEQLIERMEEITELAGLGIVAETLTHELNTLVSNTKKNTDEVAGYFKNKYEPDKKIERYFNFVKYSSDSIRKQVSHLSPGFRSVRTLKRNIKASEILKEHIDNYSDRATRLGINIKLSISDDFEVNVSQGMIHQVFDNLYLNSEHWLQHSLRINKIQVCEYSIVVIGNGRIHVWDNGIGIDPSIENQIFDPFVSNKKNGRGLGLYIVTKLLQHNKCTIRLMRERNQFNNLYKLELDFSKCLSS